MFSHENRCKIVLFAEGSLYQVAFYFIHDDINDTIVLHFKQAIIFPRKRLSHILT